MGDISDEERRRIAQKFMRVGESSEEKNRRSVEELFQGFMGQGAKIQSGWVPPPSGVDPKWGPPPTPIVESTIVKCRGCGQKNRVRFGAVGVLACGKCKKKLGVLSD